MNNLIGISGKIGSGKDLVGQIIQYLATTEGTNEFTFEDYINNPHDHTALFVGNTYRIKKYADKLKDIVCLMIGCTRADLEDREFKEKPLGEEWWYYCTSYRGSVPQNITPYVDFEPVLHISKYHLMKTTPRLLLQLMGTECGRQILHPNIWINALFTDYKANFEIESLPDCISETKFKQAVGVSNWVITDVRFPDEVKAIEDRGGIVIRLDRWSITEVSKSDAMDIFKKGGQVYALHEDGSERLCEDIDIFSEEWEKYVIENKTSTHESEMALDEYPFKYTIINNGTIEELVKKVKYVLNESSE